MILHYQQTDNRSARLLPLRRIGFLTLIVASWSCVCAFADWTPEPVHFDPTPIHYVWQGPDQSVYAGGGRDENHLLRWEETGWETLAPLPGRIYFGFTSSDGTVWFLTRQVFPEPSPSVSNIEGFWRWESGTEAPMPVEGFDPASFRTLTHFHAAEDKQGRIFMTTQSPVIYLIEEGRFKKWHSVEIPEKRNLYEDSPAEWGYLYPSRLADGRVVVVGYGPSNYNVFSDYLIIDDLQVQACPIPKVNQTEFYYSGLRLLRAVSNGLVYSTGTRRVLLLNVEAHKFEELAHFPYSDDLGSFELWMQDGDNAWAIFRRIHTSANEPQKSLIRLWQKINDGVWKPFSAWIDYGKGQLGHYFNAMPTAYPFVSSDNAVWIGTHDFGVIRADSESGDFRYLNWRHGLPLNDATWLLPLPDGQIWAGGVGNFQGSASFDPEIILKREHPDNRILSFPPLTESALWPSTQSSDGTVYELRSVNNKTGGQLILRKWTGQSWETLLIEKLSINTLLRVLLADRQNRIWVVEIHRDRAGTEDAVIIDGTTMEPVITGKFDDLLVAYAQIEQDPGFLPGFNIRRSSFFPYISPQGHVLYLNDNALYVYNGERWGPLRPSDISDGYTDYRLSLYGYTEDTGHAAVRIRNTTYKLTESGKWVATDAAFVRVEGELTLHELDLGRHLHQRVVETYGFSPESRIWNVGEGIHWIQTPDAQAYVAYGPWTAPVIPKGGATPLPVVENFSAYYTANTGQRLLRVGMGWLVFPTPNPGVPPIVTATLLSPERVLLNASKTSDVTAWRWRLNDGPWSKEARQDQLDAFNLLRGQHRIELQPLSLGLTWMEALTVELQIDYDLELMLTEAVRDLLISEDWQQRNLAARRLAIAPKEAATLLHAVDADALGYEDQWWLKAAIQKTQRTQPVINQIHPHSTEQ